MPYRRGQVLLVLFPDSNLRTAKRRPVLVVQRSDLSSGLRQSVVAMISSNLARAGHPSRVSMSAESEEGKAAGLRLDSIVMTDNLATILDTEVDRPIGALTSMDAVDRALSHTLGLRLAEPSSDSLPD